MADSNRWELEPKGGIKTDLQRLTRGQDHSDHLEMGGRTVNAIVKWKISSRREISLERIVRWPMLREKKDDTHAALSVPLKSEADPALLIDGKPYSPGSATEVRIRGGLEWTEANGNLKIRRSVFPSTSLPCLLERWEITNVGKRGVSLDMPKPVSEELLPIERFAWAAHRVRTEWLGGSRTLVPGETAVIGLAFSAREEGTPALRPDIEAEWAARQAYIKKLEGDLVLETGDPVVDRLFAFSKLRAAENVLATRGGLMHAPGGFNRYLAALWCNDQNEYVSPFFPFLGDEGGNESARNAYAWFAKYMNPEFKHIPSSIVAEGRGVWQGAGDRGDAAMTAYGASRWALASGDRRLALEVMPLIEWCLEYCRRKTTAEGVVASDSDELEGRFSSGKTNLATSTLYYDALLSAAHLSEELGMPQRTATTYRNRARDLRAAIEKVFGATVSGFETYRYHEGLTKLRSWICLPLVMDIHDRVEGTVAALFSPNLWTQDGLLTEVGSTTYWDRSTLYALRGVFRAGKADEGATYLRRYAERRLLGDHVPYCQEAYPEQNQSHLSAESGLYCRIFTEGACGIRPTGFSSFDATPQIPKSWKRIKLSRIHAFGQVWNYTASRKGAGIELVIQDATGKELYRATKPAGQAHSIKLR